MKITYKAMLAAAFAACNLLSSCTLEPYFEPQVEIYTKGFVNRFGLIDPQHDWNAARRKGVTVTVDNADVKIYAQIHGTYYLVANYQDVSGTQLLKFDVPEGTTDLIIKAKGQKYNAKVGDSVNLTGVLSRENSSTTITDGTIQITELTDASNSASWLRMPKSGVLAYNDVAPENRDNRYRDGVDLNFLYQSNGPFIIHPVYWNTSSDNELGIYVYVPVGTPNSTTVTNYDEFVDVNILRIPVFNRSTNKVLFCYPNTSGAAEASDFDSGIYLKKDSEKWALISGYNNIKAFFDYATADKEHAQLMSKGIKVDIPVGVKFGMYIKHSGGAYFYSESALNADSFYDCVYPTSADPIKNGGDSGLSSTYTQKIQRPWQASHVATFTGKARGLIALMFEDWADTSGDSDMDLNDNVFVFFGADPTKDETVGIPIIRPTETIVDSPYQWIIAAEDLGATDDFDFNDVVIGVEYVSGETTAYLTALAAGGTLPVEICYNDVPIACDGETQFHSWFVGNPSTRTMINTSSNNYKAKGRVAVTVPTDFSLAGYQNTGETYTNMGGFTIKVTRSDTTTETITPPGPGEAPQMICVPGGWAWPKERKDICLGYEKFAEWVGDRTKNYDWFSDEESINANFLMFAPTYTEQGSASTGSTVGTSTGIGSEFVITVPEGDRELSPDTNANIGYLCFTLDMENIANENGDSQLKKAWRYYKSYATSGTATEEELTQYENNLKNALLKHYWNLEFYTATEDNVYPTYNSSEDNIYSCLSGTTYGNGHTFMLLEIMRFAEVYTYSNTAKVIAKITQTTNVSGGNSGGGSGSGTTDPTPVDPDPSENQEENTIVLNKETVEGPGWNQTEIVNVFTLSREPAVGDVLKFSYTINDYSYDIRIYFGSSTPNWSADPDYNYWTIHNANSEDKLTLNETDVEKIGSTYCIYTISWATTVDSITLYPSTTE